MDDNTDNRKPPGAACRSTRRGSHRKPALDSSGGVTARQVDRSGRGTVVLAAGNPRCLIEAALHLRPTVESGTRPSQAGQTTRPSTSVRTLPWGLVERFMLDLLRDAQEPVERQTIEVTTTDLVPLGTDGLAEQGVIH